jgi:ABC-type bacteriocin/lantibiotic exporter with double-glycine peptidase domain
MTPISAVDAGVSAFIVENCLCGILKNRTVVLVTHQLNALEFADNIIILERGEVIV